MKIAFWMLISFFKELLFKIRSPQHLARRREQNKKHILAHLKDYSFYDDKKIKCWEDIPVVDKKIYTANFERFNLLQMTLSEATSFGESLEKDGDFLKKKKGYTIGLSTGTSGVRSAFIINSREIGVWAGTIIAKVLGWSFFRPQRIAFVFRAHSPLYDGINLGWIKLNFFNLNSPIEEIAPKIKVFNPSVFMSVPNFYSQYLKMREKADIQPRLLISGADVLEGQEKLKIESYFKAPLREVYQATEGFLGVSCEKGQMHLNEDFYIVEKKFLTDEVFVPILSDAKRKTQAIIRYQLDDLLCLGVNPCSCGRPSLSIKSIDGRSDQVLTFEAKDGQKAEIFPDFLRQLISKSGRWYHWDYRIEQNAADSMDIIVDKQLEVSEVEKMKQHIRLALEPKNASWVNLRIRTDESLASKAAKRKRIVNLWANTFTQP